MKEEIKKILDECFTDWVNECLVEEFDLGDGEITVEDLTEHIVTTTCLYVCDKADSINEAHLAEPLVRELLSSKEYQDALEKAISDNLAKD